MFGPKSPNKHKSFSNKGAKHQSKSPRKKKGTPAPDSDWGFSDEEETKMDDVDDSDPEILSPRSPPKPT